jgi:DNA-binding beta-propeller fold protein YncE
MKSTTLLRTLSLTAAAAGLAACGGDDPCDPEAPNTICTIAGSGEQGFNGDRGPATQAAFYVPQDTAMSPDGELWVLDFNNYVVRAIDAAGNIRTVIGNGLVGDSPDPAVPRMPALDATFNHTTDLFFHDGYLYLSAWHNSRIKRVDLEDMMIENYAGLGRRTYYDGDGGPALMASLDLPSSIALDPDKNIVIMDQANQVVRKIDADGNITRIVGTCVVELDQPCAPGVQPQACPDSNKLACGDLVTECAKPCTPGYGGDGGNALDARLGQPYGQAADPAGRVVYDRAGNLLLADTENNRIRKVDKDGIITTIAGTGVAGYSGDGGPAAQAQINRPVDVAVGPDNTVYFTDVQNNCVRKIDPAGIISAVAGRCVPTEVGAGLGFSGDGGPPLEAKMDRPYGIELVGNKLYVADSYNNRIRVVNLP